MDTLFRGVVLCSAISGDPTSIEYSHALIMLYNKARLSPLILVWPSVTDFPTEYYVVQAECKSESHHYSRWVVYAMPVVSGMTKGQPLPRIPF